jgi:predicted nuclease of predicted toxin-antitoxin system
MKFKLDENFGTRTQQLFRDAGHEIKTVYDQQLQGCTDQRLFDIVCNEDYCLVALDLDFASVTRFPPAQTHGLVVSRVPQNPSLFLLEQMIRRFLDLLPQMPVERKLRIVEVDRVRIHEPSEPNGETAAPPVQT